MHGKIIALSVVVFAVGLAAGVGLERRLLSDASMSGAAGEGPKILYWVAPMDPNFRKDGPGKSPMGMDLVPVYEGQEASGDSAEVRLSASEINAIGVRTAVSRIEEISARIETVGFVAYDEHATSHIHMRVDGWIEDLKVRAEGDRVAKGDLLFELYAPEITIASSELLRATKDGDAVEAAVARRKLMNFGVSERQIEEMARAAEPAQHIRVYAPQNGVVTDLNGADGMYLQPETRAMSLSDLSSVWLVVDVFERDIARLSKNMTAQARFEHLPGRVFSGAIDYIYPALDPKTRTLPVRLRFDNRERLLRPNMFGSVALIPDAARRGVTAPSEAIIRTGRAERVILRTAEGVFKPRLVTTGLRDSFGEGGRTEIVQGLAAGEVVVASAQFLIDSESALNAGLTRFAPTADKPARGKGVLVSLDASARRAVIRHDALASLDWPAMETEFALAADVTLDRLKTGDAIRFAAARGADGLIALLELKPDDGVDAVGTGVVHAITSDGKLNLTHEPIPELGWGAMTMDLPVEGFDPKDAPIGEAVSFDLVKGADGLFTITGLRTARSEARKPQEAARRPDMRNPPSPPMRVSGTIDSVDAKARTATVTHGPIREIGMPGMTMVFPLGDAVDPDALPVGAELSLLLEKGENFSLTLVGVDAEGSQ